MLTLAGAVLRSKEFLRACSSLVAAVCLSAFQYGDRNGLNGLPFAEVQPMVADLTTARRLAQQGNVDLFAGQVAPGKPVTIRGELTDGNCYLGTHTHAYDHAFCAKVCAAAGSSLVFVADQGGSAYVVLTPRNGVPLTAEILDQIGVPGIVIRGEALEADGVRALAIEKLQK